MIYKNLETTEIPPHQSLCQCQTQALLLLLLLLGVGDLHGAGGGDPEALQGVLGHARLRVALKLHEGDVVFARHQTHLLEPWKPEGQRRGQ